MLGMVWYAGMNDIMSKKAESENCNMYKNEERTALTNEGIGGVLKHDGP